ncbi:MAG: outer membrane lipoprotein-sorting protein [Candidatus Binatia bacterium]|nr:outer membrane lipoprotein-sorting protein [Candidatus Binatia bacterium]
MLKNMKLTAALSVLPAFLAVATPALSEDDAGTLVQKAVDNLPKVPVQAKLKLTPPHGDPRTVGLSSKMIKGQRASYLEVSEPVALKGIRFLFLEKPGAQSEQYMKIAMAPNPMKVSGQIRKNPFLESTFFVSDMVEPVVSDYTYEYVGDGGIGGRAVKQVKATPKDKEKAIYGSMVISIDPKDLIVLKREFSDKDGKPYKEWTVDVVEEVDGILTIRDQHMKNLQNDTQSRLETVEIEYNGDVPDNTFSPAHLKR